jgi:hypothetical protein
MVEGDDDESEEEDEMFWVQKFNGTAVETMP